MKIKNWQHLCIFGRISSTYIDIDGKMIFHDGKDIIIKVRNDGNDVDYIDKESKELLLTQGEDGWPTYLSEWAKKTPTSGYELA